MTLRDTSHAKHQGGGGGGGIWKNAFFFLTFDFFANDALKNLLGGAKQLGLSLYISFREMNPKKNSTLPIHSSVRPSFRQYKLPTRLVPRRLEYKGCIWERLTRHYILDFIFHFSHFFKNSVIYISGPLSVPISNSIREIF